MNDLIDEGIERIQGLDHNRPILTDKGISGGRKEKVDNQDDKGAAPICSAEARRICRFAGTAFYLQREDNLVKFVLDIVRVLAELDQSFASVVNSALPNEPPA